MIVADLIKLLRTQPQDADAWLATACHGCFEPALTVYRDERGMVVVYTGTNIPEGAAIAKAERKTAPHLTIPSQ